MPGVPEVDQKPERAEESPNRFSLWGYDNHTIYIHEAISPVIGFCATAAAVEAVAAKALWKPPRDRRQTGLPVVDEYTNWRGGVKGWEE
jgi:hypothetical protein